VAESSDGPADEIRSLFTGDKTPGDSFLPPVVFLMVNSLRDLRAGAIVAVGVGAAVALWRMSKGQKGTYAVGGIIAVAFASLIALRTGRAEGFFLPGIVGAGVGAFGAVISVAVKRPMTAWTSYSMRRWPLDWYWRDDVRPAYTRVTWIWIGYLVVRFVGQLWLFTTERPEWLAAFKLATSFPTIIPLLFLSHRIGTTHRAALGGPSVEEFETDAPPPWQGQQEGF
jgi:predicted RecA/RadA family phage recombinase